MKQDAVLKFIMFWWEDAHGDGELVLYNKTYQEALKQARSFGYRERHLLKPWTWKNDMVYVE